MAVKPAINGLHSVISQKIVVFNLVLILVKGWHMRFILRKLLPQIIFCKTGTWSTKADQTFWERKLLLWDVMQCSMVDSYLASNFKVEVFSTIKMEEPGSSETYKTTRHQSHPRSHLHSHSHVMLKSKIWECPIWNVESGLYSTYKVCRKAIMKSVTLKTD
jgi:hypothetical protein